MLYHTKGQIPRVVLGSELVRVLQVFLKPQKPFYPPRVLGL
jgi:hypothetical protein